MPGWRHIVVQCSTNSALCTHVYSKFIDYLFHDSHFHKMVSSGIAMNTFLNSHRKVLSGIGIESSVSYQTFRHACTGYAKMVQFKKEDFLCPSCGDSPNYIVCDGKTNGPTKRKVDHLHELDRAEDDESVLAQGSSFERSVLV